MALKRLSDEFHLLNRRYAGKHATFSELIQQIKLESQALVTLALSLPFLFFIPLPGLSIVFGIFIFLNGFFICLKKKLWIPSFIGKKRISAHRLREVLRLAEKWSKRLEKIVFPRMHFLIDHPVFTIFNGIVLCFCGFFLALPLPPGTNFFPGLNVALLSLAILERDGLLIGVSYLLFLINCLLYLILPIWGLLHLVK